MINLTGFSDDNVVITTDQGSDEIPCYNEKVIFTFLNSKKEGVEIRVWYDVPTWAFTVMQLPDEEIDVPWPITIDQDSSYSLVLEIQSEDDITWTYEKEDL